MHPANRKTMIALAGCILAVASLCIAAVGETKRPKSGKKRPRRVDVALKIGQTAPDFELYTLEHALAMEGKPAPKTTSRPACQPADGKVRLSSFRGKRPVYLIFASYT